MNRWSYQNTLRLVFNLDTERGREAQREQDEEREGKAGRGRERCFILVTVAATVEPLARHSVAYRCFPV